MAYMIRKRAFLCKSEIERDYFHSNKGGTKMTWYPDDDDYVTIKDEEEL
jgi:hypothetical protein